MVVSCTCTGQSRGRCKGGGGGGILYMYRTVQGTLQGWWCWCPAESRERCNSTQVPKAQGPWYYSRSGCLLHLVEKNSSLMCTDPSPFLLAYALAASHVPAAGVACTRAARRRGAGPAAPLAPGPAAEWRVGAGAAALPSRHRVRAHQQGAQLQGMLFAGWLLNLY